MRRFGLIVCVLALTSCTETTAPVDDLSAIQVRVRAAPEDILVQELTTITVTLTNTKPWRVQISECPIYFSVKDPAGTVVGGSDVVGCFGFTREQLVYAPLEFGGLETKTFVFDWFVPQSVPAGEYNLFGWANTPDHASPAVPITVSAAN